MPNKNKKNLMGTLMLHIAAFIWGTAFIFQKILVTEGIPPFYTTAMRFCFIGVVFFFYRNFKFNKTALMHGGIMGLLLTIGIITQTYGLAYIDASVSAFLTSISLILIPVFNYAMFKKRINKYNIYAIISALIGVILFNQQSGESAGSIDFGIVITLIGSLAFTLHIVLSSHFLEKNGESPMSLHIIQCIVVAVLCFVLAFSVETFPANWTYISIFSIVYLGLFSSVLGFGAQALGQFLTKNPLKAGLIISLEPGWAFVLSIPLLGEQLTAGKALGILFIGFGIVFCEWETILKLKNQKAGKYNEEIQKHNI